MRLMQWGLIRGLVVGLLMFSRVVWMVDFRIMMGGMNVGLAPLSGKVRVTCSAIGMGS